MGYFVAKKIIADTIISKVQKEGWESASDYLSPGNVPFVFKDM